MNKTMNKTMNKNYGTMIIKFFLLKIINIYFK